MTEPSPTEFSLGHNVASREDVDADPDGHLWEVAWNPAWEIEE